jgi:hypothetical protein
MVIGRSPLPAAAEAEHRVCNACVHSDRARWRASDHPPARALYWAGEMLPATCTAPVAEYVWMMKRPGESWKASKLVAPPGPMKRIFLPAGSYLTP